MIIPDPVVIVPEIGLIDLNASFIAFHKYRLMDTAFSRPPDHISDFGIRKQSLHLLYVFRAHRFIHQAIIRRPDIVWILKGSFRHMHDKSCTFMSRVVPQYTVLYIGNRNPVMKIRPMGVFPGYCLYPVGNDSRLGLRRHKNPS